MSDWNPHRDLARLIEALGRELIASGEPEVHAACLDHGDSVRTAAQHVRELIGTLIDDPDEPDTAVHPLEWAHAREFRARQH